MKPLKISAVCMLCLGSLHAFFGTVVLTAQDALPPRTVLVLTFGVTEEGRVTPAWVEAIRARHDEGTLAAILDSTKSVSEEEARWADLIQSRVATWSDRMDSLTIPFKAISPPGAISIVLGNVGGEDAFIYAASTDICPANLCPGACHR